MNIEEMMKQAQKVQEEFKKLGNLDISQQNTIYKLKFNK